MLERSQGRPQGTAAELCFVCVCVRMCVCACVRERTCVYVHVDVCVCLYLCVCSGLSGCIFACRVGQNRIYTPYLAVHLVISLPNIPYIHRIYMVMANPIRMPHALEQAVRQFGPSSNNMHTHECIHTHTLNHTHTRAGPYRS
jgi:hypothetical protein